MAWNLYIGTAPAAAGSLTFVENAVNSYEYLSLSAFPTNFGVGEFALGIQFKCLSNGTYTLGDVTGGGLAQRQLWSNSNPTRYGAASWWYNGNFLLDGHNNTNFYAGTCSVQIANGRARWLFGDGSPADALTGDLWGVQNMSAASLLDNSWHELYLVRRRNGSGADLELWVDGSLQDTQTTSAMTDMWTNYWSGGFAGWPSGQRIAVWGSEKQAALNLISQWEDFKGQIGRIAFWSLAPSSAWLGTPFRRYSGQEYGLMAYYLHGEQQGTTSADAKGGTSISLVNAPAWSGDKP